MERRRAMGLFMGVIAAWAVSGCALGEKTEPPRVRLADMQFLDGGLFAQQIGLDLLVGNPNNFDLALEGLTFALEVNGQPFADGFSNQAVTIPRLSEVKVPVKASTTVFSLVEQALILGERAELEYRLRGVAHLSGLAKRSVPYEQAGRLRLLPGRATGGETLVPL